MDAEEVQGLLREVRMANKESLKESLTLKLQQLENLYGISTEEMRKGVVEGRLPETTIRHRWLTLHNRYRSLHD